MEKYPKAMKVVKNPFDDMIFHLYHQNSKSYPDLHDATIHNDCLLDLLPTEDYHELQNLKLGETWEKKLRFVVVEE